MKAGDIIRRLMWGRHRRTWCLPNYTPHGWFECDVMNISNAGYMQEFEVKVTKADFLADSAKQDRLGLKHERLAVGDVRGPRQFYFCVPDDLAQFVEIPRWAGLLLFRSRGKQMPIEQVVRQAPMLHSTKVDQKVRDHAKSVCYWRMHRLYQMLGMPKLDETTTEGESQ